MTLLLSCSGSGQFREQAAEGRTSEVDLPGLDLQGVGEGRSAAEQVTAQGDEDLQTDQEVQNPESRDYLKHRGYHIPGYINH